jgi:predicted nicotinamide N-methyase
LTHTGQSGTTGFRTWEASLHLSTYLCSLPATHAHSPTDRKILELGSGTGFLTILCAGHLQAAHITATDGFTHVLDDLRSNLALNDLEDSTNITVKQLKWGEDLWDNGETDDALPGGQVDLIIGADVTYDAAALPALTSTIADLMTLYPNAQILLASTVRNPETYAKFLRLCGERGWKVKDVDWPIQAPEEQIGPFYALDKGMEVRICEIIRSREQEDMKD